MHLMKNEDEGSFLSKVSVDDFWRVYYAVLADHPEIFWIGTSAQVEESSLSQTVVSYSLETTVAQEDRASLKAELEEAADSCIAQIRPDASDYEKMKYVY